jgi:hypothetical protein
MNQKLEEVLMEKKLALSLTIAKILSSFLVAVTVVVMLMFLPLLILLAVVEWSISTLGTILLIIATCAYFLFL